MLYNFLQFFFNFPFKVLIFIVVFTIPLTKRKYFWIRAIGVGILYICSFYFIPITGYLYNIVLFSLSIVWIICCFSASWYVMIFCAVAAFAGQHISYYIFRIIEILFLLPNNSILGLIISISICALVAALCYFVFVSRIDYHSIIVSRSILFNSIIILSLTIVGGEFIPKDNSTTNILYCIYTIVSCSLALAMQYGVSRQNELKEENEKIQQMMYMENKQRQLSKQTVEMLNIRCHDLKHQIELLENENSTHRQSELIDELKEAINNYDNVINCGYEPLDTVLTEKNYLCKQEGIIFSYIVDGEKLSFISDADIYSLFGNSLDNAIEAVKGVKKEKRIISLSVQEKQGYIHIHLENYFNEDLKFNDGLPISTKKGQLHGYGTKSIRFIAEKYNGTATITAKDCWYKLNILFPLQESNNKAKN